MISSVAGNRLLARTGDGS